MKSKITPQSDYILLRPEQLASDKSKFQVSEGTAIKEIAVVESVGPRVEHAKHLIGKRVIFNAWSCDEKVIKGERYYFTSESANSICAVIS